MQAEKQRKKILVPNSVHTRPGQENSEKNSKKIQKPLSGIIVSQNGLIQDEKQRKKFQSRIPFIQTWTRKFPKKQQKNSKTSFRHYCLPKQDDIGREIEKKNLVPNSVHTRPGQENFEKNCKKSKNLFLALFIAKNWIRQAEKEKKKKVQSRIPIILDLGKKIPKKIAKKFKNLKHLFLALFLAKLGLDRLRNRKKNSSPKFRSNSIQERKFRKKQQQN